MSAAPKSRPWPVELVFDSAAKALHIRFDDGASFTVSYQLLRVESPSAEVQGHGANQKALVKGKQDVAVAGAVPVGRYAVRIQFDDGHDTGLFSWDYLRKLGEEQDALMAAYQARLAAQA